LDVQDFLAAEGVVDFENIKVSCGDLRVGDFTNAKLIYLLTNK
jgi:hypothetical protein